MANSSRSATTACRASPGSAIGCSTASDRIDVMLVVFDVLAIDGRDVTRRPYWERRQLLEDLDLEGDAWSTTPSLPGRRSAVGEGLRARLGRRRREEALGPLSARPTRLDQDQEPRLLAVSAGTCRRAGAALAGLSVGVEQFSGYPPTAIAFSAHTIRKPGEGILMERNGLTDDEAFNVLRQISQRTNVKLREVRPWPGRSRGPKVGEIPMESPPMCVTSLSLREPGIDVV